MTDQGQTVGELLGRCLRAVGATRVFGSPDSGVPGIPGLTHVRVDEPELAALLAAAAGRIGQGPGVALLPGRRLLLSSAPGIEPDRFRLDDPEALPFVIASWTSGLVFAATELLIEVDLDAPAGRDVTPVRLEPGGRAISLDPALADDEIVILAGPGVLRHDATKALAALARDLGVGVVNTWGAKGVFRWDSPHHYGTAGLQARDFELAGVTSADVVIAVGVDPLESPRTRWEGPAVLEIEPWQLGALALRWPGPAELPPPPALYRELAGALRPLYASAQVPLSPARAVADAGEVRPEGALVVADPGPAGLWVARALPTTEAGSVVVPSAVQPGFAVAAGAVASLDGRLSISITTDPIDETTEAVLELAEHWGAQIVLEVWGDGASGAELVSPEARRERLHDALQSRRVNRLPVAVDFASTDVLVEIAGPVVAWESDRGAMS
ncbi:MAG: hypothetical protein N2037_11740 [Acidimicrobiales bacterium]|nr:hypothetical protein [Acidimicrobiales bacterium]